MAEVGPCCICGATNYSLSMGGPTICPSCDCGDFGMEKVKRQGIEIVQLNELLRSEGANRYWEGRWRDEKAENDRLRTLSQNNATSWDALVRERDALRAEVEALRDEVERLHGVGDFANG